MPTEADGSNAAATAGAEDTDGPATDDGRGDETAAPRAGRVYECIAAAEAVEFDNTPPRGETRVPGLGSCVDLLEGEDR